MLWVYCGNQIIVYDIDLMRRFIQMPNNEIMTFINSELSAFEHLSHYSYPNERFIDHKLSILIVSVIRVSVLLKSRLGIGGRYVHIVFWSCTLQPM